MILYNTTYQMPETDARNFVIWVHEVMLPQVREFGHMNNGRLSRILSHKEEGTECFALQFEVESTARLHYWFVKQGKRLTTESRVLALIRIGITDNQSIAAILRASLTTIYTYRSKLKARALDKDNFESNVKSIDC